MGNGASHLDVNPGAVANAGHQVSATAGNWQEWAEQARTALQDSASWVRNSKVSSAAQDYGSRWNPKIQRLASQVDTLGNNMTTAAKVVDHADAEAASTVVAAHQQVDGQSGVLARPIHAGAPQPV
jgi:uncharacterized protein YukE